MKAVENGSTSIGIRCKDGIVLAAEKVITSKLLKQGANKRIATVDRHLGIVRLLRFLSLLFGQDSLSASFDRLRGSNSQLHHPPRHRNEQTTPRPSRPS